MGWAKYFGLVIIMSTLFSTVAAQSEYYDLANYPFPFIVRGNFNGFIVVGDHADASDVIGSVEIATTLQTYTNEKIGYRAKLASEIEDITQINAIIVGGPCANPAAAKILGFPENCLEGFPPGVGKLILKEGENGFVSLIVAGASAIDTRRAARTLSNKDDYKDILVGNEVEIQSIIQKGTGINIEIVD